MNRQTGFTLIELLISMAISGLIVSGLGTAIYQIISVTEYGNDKLTAMHELQNASHWFNIDGQMASAASGGSELVLNLPDDSSITYTRVNNELRRTVGGSQMILAQNITSANFSVDTNIITMTATSSPEGRWDVSESGTYKVYLRPD